MQPIHTILTGLCACTLFAPLGLAQNFLFTTTQPEQTVSGSGGTVLQQIRPNEIAVLESFPCPGSAEKWAPRTMFHTIAGDEDNDDNYWEPGLMGQIDALVTTRASTAIGTHNQRTVYYSVSQAVGTTVSGAPGLRPGDVGRIVRQGGLDGQVQYFIRAEQVQIALGLPPFPVFVNVDAVAQSPNIGVIFSLETDVVAPLCTGTVLVRDGDVLMIPAADLVWSPNGTVAAVAAGRAVVVHTEAQMDAFVWNAWVANHLGALVTQIGDTDALEIDWNGTMFGTVPTCGGPMPVPQLMFAGENLTGGAVLNTRLGGSIHTGGCGLLGTPFSSGPTLGLQIGLRPPSAAMGIPSSVNALNNGRFCRFVSQAQVPQTPVFTPAVIDFASPAPTTWVFFAFAPGGPGAVPTSTPFPWGLFCYPDYYAAPNFMGAISTAGGWGTYTSPPVPWPVDLVWFGVTILGSSIEISTPAMVEVY